eukprot:scaffold2808_cov255-Pinguiococcus_pyrenoidosus.AAC.20
MSNRASARGATDSRTRTSSSSRSISSCQRASMRWRCRGPWASCSRRSRLAKPPASGSWSSWKGATQRRAGKSVRGPHGGSVSWPLLIESAGVGDVLLACTGVKVVGAKYERPLVQADILDWDTIMSAIASNEEKYASEPRIAEPPARAGCSELG